MEAKSIHRNMSQGVDSLAQCLNVLRLVARAKHQLDSHALFAALQTLEELENVHLRRVSQYTFSQRLARRIPLMREAVQDSVIADLKEWFYQLRDLSRKAGTLAMKRARDRQVRWRRLSQQRKQMGFSSSILELVMDEENEGDILDNEEVHIDFRPLYQCIHIHSTLGKANSFRKMYEEDRQAQVDLIVSPSVNFNAPEALKSMGKMLQELVGFFIVDHVVVHTTQEFRSKARVDVLWTMVSDKVTRLIADATRKCSDLQRLFEIRKMLMCFVSALEGYLYDCHKPRELMVILAERYAALIMEGCGERFRKIVDEDEYRPMQVSSEEELEAVRSAYPFQESTQGLVSQGSTREGRVSKDSSYSSPSAGRSTGSFPRTLPFSTILPLCCVDVKRCISEYYQYVAGEDGHAAVAAADSVLQQAVDGYLTKMVLPALLAKLRSTILSQVVQIVINMEYFESACGEFERFLYNQRISPHLDMPQGEDGSVGRVKLRARAGFVEAKIRCERRVYELVNIKIDQFLDLSNYSWMPSTPIPEPSQYMVDLVGYLKMVFTSVLVDLRPQIRKLVRFEAVDHLATSLTTLLFGSKVTQFNRNFILCAQADIQTLQTFLEELGDPNLLDTLTELQQVSSEEKEKGWGMRRNPTRWVINSSISFPHSSCFITPSMVIYLGNG